MMFFFQRSAILTIIYDSVNNLNSSNESEMFLHYKQFTNSLMFNRDILQFLERVWSRVRALYLIKLTEANVLNGNTDEYGIVHKIFDPTGGLQVTSWYQHGRRVIAFWVPRGWLQCSNKYLAFLILVVYLLKFSFKCVLKTHRLTNNWRNAIL